MLIACTLAMFQQITGASILTMYMPTVFQDARISKLAQRRDLSRT